MFISLIDLYWWSVETATPTMCALYYWEKYIMSRVKCLSKRYKDIIYKQNICRFLIFSISFDVILCHLYLMLYYLKMSLKACTLICLMKCAGFLSASPPSAVQAWPECQPQRPPAFSETDSSTAVLTEQTQLDQQ